MRFLVLVSILTTTIFAFLFSSTTLLDGLIHERNSLCLQDWLAEGSDTLMLLAIVVILLILFYHFQERLIDQERRAQAELRHAQALLEEHNVALEQKVKERTEQLLQSNKIQTALYEITDAASVSHDMQEFYAHVHRIVGGLMYAGNFFIALYDDATGLLSFPYFVDEKDAPASTQPLQNFHGMTSYIIRTGVSFGSERLYGVLKEETSTPARLLKNIEQRLHAFIGTAEQFDDITVLAVKRDSY